MSINILNDNAIFSTIGSGVFGDINLTKGTFAPVKSQVIGTINQLGGTVSITNMNGPNLYVHGTFNSSSGSLVEFIDPLTPVEYSYPYLVLDGASSIQSKLIVRFVNAIPVAVAPYCLVGTINNEIIGGQFSNVDFSWTQGNVSGVSVSTTPIAISISFK
ncbi:hypothetical protein SAMD00019534_088010 [Acytostelium subglobosum LB1]|uniref:hypothetical protein n=1 Tax=Acytostelium subglobosum LB1 TaxID=1410327 RepID=UPI000644EF26|nr:hypothetical protein SAMD00019534_088010 [Acytostelium subglobosum LB1]GAM25626.1 hypothetical protein SAMD00019534_088010 [Acytostelium subglobosum LB1]|eukprot:XP_012751612.1 hypothetical protein SAMD00019534_088010 [Acytostelium subglobosum LB1]